MLEYARKCLVVADSPGPAKQCLFVGLRVRMGMHAGVLPSELLLNPVDRRTRYTGEALACARAVEDAGGASCLRMLPAPHMPAAVCPAVPVQRQAA